MLKDENGELRVKCLLAEYADCSDGFRHTYATIWQSGIVFATISGALFGFFVSFQTQLKLSLPYLPFIPLSVIILWWSMVFEPMNRYGDVRAKRCAEIENEMSNLIPSLKMKHYSTYGESKIRFLRVRVGVRILAVIVIALMVLLVLSFFFPSILPVGFSGNQTST